MPAPEDALIQELEAEISVLRDQHAMDLSASNAPSQEPSTDVFRTPTPRDARDEARSTVVSREQPNPYALNPDDLEAPVTAIHAMTPETPRRHGGYDWDATQAILLPSITEPQDFLTDKALDETVARELFNSFMAGSNTFLPMFDPVLDTFDSLRVRSPFCFAVILSTAARAREASNPMDNLRQTCQNEARRLAAETLFIGVPVLEDAQAMTLLAAFSERTYFAIGHATQMALLLNLQKALAQLLVNRHLVSSVVRKKDRLLTRQARTWLMVLFIEWEIAAGTARPPRLEAIGTETLRAFALHPASNVSDSRMVSLLELVVLRAEMQRELEAIEELSMVAMTKVRSACARFDSWCSFWDKAFADSGYPQSSFQRTSLYVSREYAKTSGDLARFGDSSLDPVTAEILSYMMNIMYSQLSFLVKSPAYKWHLKFAPTYTALTIAFTCVLALKMSKLKPGLIEQSRLEPVAKEVAKLLQTHPHQNFHHVIRLLMSVPQNFKNISFNSHMGSTSNTSNQTHPLHINASGDMIPPRFPDDEPNAQNVEGASTSQAMYFPSVTNIHAASQQGGDSIHRNWLENWGQLESSWLLDSTSNGLFGLPNNGNASVFDFDLPMDVQAYQHEGWN
ncbi:hypothetical protein LTR10_011568 [Elasticomyces elasticus]|uniref:Transcription factor domain-containing protein n=1 Tax=Exophiala sideris TaxID=1016849 RepID=A0ABR0JDG0_9EURO|nr:hypothetical protein LTR10_011568 [Elasticomyces elasticus]KAK5031975.1 hypothetical protein LTS07_004596 [Exophiala sideris]KAK5040904.1 hypothetical protein LTR13_003205 [Exophiala sideris]KAK5061762.1 hypothetical protein LTR69_004945 [Exophiala sideris]KAK5184462.1 hypothetical protein LTR44_003136 [Eurotiomycetes sp. CCFEE 6388]